MSIHLLLSYYNSACISKADTWYFYGKIGQRFPEILTPHDDQNFVSSPGMAPVFRRTIYLQWILTSVLRQKLKLIRLYLSAGVISPMGIPFSLSRNIFQRLNEPMVWWFEEVLLYFFSRANILPGWKAQLEITPLALWFWDEGGHEKRGPNNSERNLFLS